MECEGGSNCNAKAKSGDSNQSNSANPSGVIVLGVYIHCEGCYDKVFKCLKIIDGVECVEIDPKNHKVTVKGKKADPTKVVEKLRRKTGKHVELIAPKLQERKKEEKKEEKKKEPPVVEVVLKMYLHCQGCAKDVKHCILKMPGVQTVQTDMEKNLVSVKGAIEAEKLVKFVKKRAGRHGEIMKPPQKKDCKNEEKKCEQNSNNHTICYENYPPGLVYAPQLFSDENPNACSIM